MGTQYTYKAKAKCKVYVRGKCPKCGDLETWECEFEGKGISGGRNPGWGTGKTQEWESNARNNAYTEAKMLADSAIFNSQKESFEDIYVHCTCQKCGYTPIWGNPPDFIKTWLKSLIFVVIAYLICTMEASALIANILTYILFAYIIIPVPCHFINKARWKKRIREYNTDDFPVIAQTEEDAVIAYEVKQAIIKQKSIKLSATQPIEKTATIPTTNASSSETLPNTKLFCRVCGSNIPIDSVFCPCCGEKVIK